MTTAFGNGAEHRIEDDHSADEHGDEDVAEVAWGEGGGGVECADGVAIGDAHREGGLLGEEFGEVSAQAEITAIDLRPSRPRTPGAVFDAELEGADTPRTARPQATPFDVERNSDFESDAWAA